jgi:hypothetical protein
MLYFSSVMLIDLTRLSEEELVDLNHRIIERLQFIRSARHLTALSRFSVGMVVEFTLDDGRTIQGKITRLNRKTATVCCTPSGHWRVSPALLRAVAHGDAPAAQAPRLVAVHEGWKRE